MRGQLDLDLTEAGGDLLVALDHAHHVVGDLGQLPLLVDQVQQPTTGPDRRHHDERVPTNPTADQVRQLIGNLGGVGLDVELTTAERQPAATASGA